MAIPSEGVDASALADRVVRRRLTLGITQQVLAERVGVSVTTVSRWENGHTRARGRKLVRLQGALWRGADAADAGDGEPRAKAVEATGGAAEMRPAEEATSTHARAAQGPFLEAVVVALREGYVRDAAWIAVANEYARSAGVDWNVNLDDL